MGKHGGELSPLKTVRNPDWGPSNGTFHLRALQPGAPKHLKTDSVCEKCSKNYSRELAVNARNPKWCLGCNARQEKKENDEAMAQRRVLLEQRESI